MSYVKHNDRSLRHPCKKCKRGGSSDESLKLYWAHDTDRPTGQTCTKCHVDGKWSLIESDGSLHGCMDTDGPAPDATPSMPAPVASAPAPATAPATGTPGDMAAKLAEILTGLAPTVDMTKIIAEVNAVVNTRMAEVIEAVNSMTKTVVVEVKQHEKPSVSINGAHKMLPKVLAVLTAPGVRKHVMLVGPAGTGKSTMAKHVAEAMSIPLYEIALGPTMAESRVVGYKNAEGAYVPTFVRQWAEGGGVLHLDEFDAGNPGVLTVFNSLLSNGHFGFPDEMIGLHPDCYVVASLNTYGRGADRTYKGRQALDEATLNRFVKIPVYYDNEVEKNLCLQTGLPEHKVNRVLTYVRSLRAKAESDKMSVIMGVRESEGLCSLLATGEITADEAIEWRIRGGLSDADWQKLTSGITPPSFA